MRVRCLLFVLPLFLIGCSFSGPGVPEARPALPEEVSVENGFLLFRGAVLHPGAFQDLEVMIADVKPTVAAVDLEGCQETERYGISKPTVRGKAVRTSNAGTLEAETLGVVFFDYEYIGVTPAGTHLVRVAEWGSGSGIFGSILLVTFESDTVLDQNQIRDRVLMKCVGEIVLGDRYAGSIELHGPRLRLGPHTGPPGESRKERWITLDRE